MNIKKLLGEKIKRLRKNRGLTQEQFSEMINIAPRNLSRIVGESFVSADTLDKIIEALSVTAEELFAYETIKEPKELLSDIYTALNEIKTNKKQLEKIYRLIKFVRENEL
jgi:transcriptional regulator with XRE-family HTH domain